MVGTIAIVHQVSSWTGFWHNLARVVSLIQFIVSFEEETPDINNLLTPHLSAS